MIDDAALLRHYAREGSQEAFAELVRRHLDQVYSTALRRVGGDTHHAQDVTQRVFCALAQKAEPLSRHPFLTAWLHAATRNEAANVVRSEQRRKAKEKEAHSMQEIVLKAAPEIDWTQVAPVLDEAIDQLNDHDRIAILLRYVDKRPFVEIGSLLHISDDAARMRVDRALDKLRSALTRRRIVSSAAAFSFALESHLVGAAPASIAASIATHAMLTCGSSTMSAVSIGQLLMSAKFLAVSTTAVLLLCGIVTYKQLRKNAQANDGFAVSERELEAATVRLHNLKNTLHEMETSRHELQTKIDALAIESFASIQNPTNRRSQIPASAQKISLLSDQELLARGRDLLKRYPEVRVLMEENRRARIDDRFFSLYQKLGFSPAEIEAFDQALAQSNSLRFGNAAGVSITVPPANGDLLPPDQIEEKIHALLGDEKYRQYHEFERSQGARELTQQLASALYLTAAPLARDQAQQLTDLLAASSSNFQKGEPFSISTINWDTALSSARNVLSNTQFSALVGLRERKFYEQELAQAESKAFARWKADLAANNDGK